MVGSATRWLLEEDGIGMGIGMGDMGSFENVLRVVFGCFVV